MAFDSYARGLFIHKKALLIAMPDTRVLGLSSGLDCSGDFARTQTSCADVDGFVRAVVVDSDFLYVWFPCAVSAARNLAARDAYSMPCADGFVACNTLCHFLHLLYWRYGAYIVE